MKNAAAAVLDILAILLIISPLFEGFIKGYKYHIFSLISIAASAAVAFAVSSVFAEPVYERFFKDEVIKGCIETAEKYSPVEMADELLESYGVDASQEQIENSLRSSESLPDSIGKLAEAHGLSGQQLSDFKEEFYSSLSQQMPESVKMMIPGGLDSLSSIKLNDAQIYDAVRACAQSPQEAAEFTEQRYISPICVSVIKSMLYLLTMGIMSLVMRLVFYIFGFSFKDKAGSGGERFGGVLLGLVIAAANIIVLAVTINFAADASGGLLEVDSLKSFFFLPLYHLFY